MTGSQRTARGSRARSILRGASAVATTIAALACQYDHTETLASQRPTEEHNVARLVLSSLSVRGGDEVSATVEVHTTADVKAIGSFTARIAFDSTVLELIGEEPASGDVVQVVNPMNGEARAAGISASGFSEAGLLRLRFRARRNGAIEQTFVTLTELHAIDRSDVLPLLASPRVSAQLAIP